MLKNFIGKRCFSTFKPLRPRPDIITNNVYDSFASAIGNTPLIRLRKASEETGCEIYGKCEFLNPGGSVKDRAGLYLVAKAEEDKLLTPGQPGLIVEGTAGNTGIGLTLVANSRGYRTIIVIPDTQSKEKKDTLRYCGAQLVEVPAYPYKDPRNYVHVAYRLSKLLQSHPDIKIPVVYPNQWDSHANRQAHIETTGPEIYKQLGGNIDAFSCAMGTGGTLAGVGMALKARNPNIFIGHTDPYGAVPFTYYTSGQKVAGTGSSITEGIGQGRITGNMEGFKPDKSWEITDERALEILHDLCFEEGLQVGLSTGINVAGAIEVAKHLGPGKTIVTVLCDGAMRYTNKMYNIAFLQSKNLPYPAWLDTKNIAYDEKIHKEISSRSPTPASLLPVDLQDLVQQALNGQEKATN